MFKASNLIYQIWYRESVHCQALFTYINRLDETTQLALNLVSPRNGAVDADRMREEVATETLTRFATSSRVGIKALIQKIMQALG
jgi:hypothetical protein